MGLFDIFLKNRPRTPDTAPASFTMINGNTPKFAPFGKEVYQSELVRASINARATHISKLNIQLMGAARPALQTKIKHAPNQFMTWSQFMYRLSTILDIHNTAFICPIYDEYGEEIDNNHHEFNSVIEDFVDCRDIYWVEFEDDFDVADFESRAA